MTFFKLTRKQEISSFSFHSWCVFISSYLINILLFVLPNLAPSAILLSLVLKRFVVLYWVHFSFVYLCMVICLLYLFLMLQLQCQVYVLRFFVYIYFVHPKYFVVLGCWGAARCRTCCFYLPNSSKV